MANAKLHDLTGLTTLAALDEMLVNDVSDTTDSTDGTTKKYAVGITSGFVGLNDTQTLTAKTLTSPTITGPTISGTVAGGAIYTSPVLTTPQINDTSSDHQYVFAVSELAADRTVTLPLLTGNDTFVFNDFTATLTNKTLTSPVLTTPQINDTSSDHQYIFAGSELTADRTVTLPLLTAGDTFVFAAFTQTLTNKTYIQRVATYTPDAAGTATLDLTTGNIQAITMPAGNITIAISNEVVGQCFLIEITQDGGGSRTVTWFTTIKWAGGSAPVLTTTASKRDVFGFRVTGTDTYDGYVVGMNI